LLAGEDVPRAPKQERSRRAREALLEAALALFAEHGFEATSVEEIATRAGIAVGGFYSHFRSKRQALLVLMDRLLAELAALDLNVPPGTPPRAIIAGLVHAGLRVDWAYAGAYRAWHELILRDAELALLARDVEAWTMSRLRLVTRVLMEYPGARGDLDVETFCWVTNQLFWRLTEAHHSDRTAVERTLAEMLGHTLLADA
jgi:AcrR family transcriptional regulator